jgi:hypothetical protein
MQPTFLVSKTEGKKLLVLRKATQSQEDIIKTGLEK